MSNRLANSILTVMGIVFVATLSFGIWMVINEPATVRHAECPVGYEFVPKQAFTSRSWCVNGELAVEPIWTDVEVTP